MCFCSYLKVLTLALHCVNCRAVPGIDAVGNETPPSLHLLIDLQQSCYAGDHLSAAIFNYFLLVLFAGAYPLGVAWVLYRSFQSDSTQAYSDSDALHARRADYFGFAFRGLKTDAWYFRLSFFVTSLGFAVQNVFNTSVSGECTSLVPDGARSCFSRPSRFRVQ
jgi:hypothetical protein